MLIGYIFNQKILGNIYAYSIMVLKVKKNRYQSIKVMIIFIWSYFELLVLIVNIHAHIKIGSAYYEPFSTNIIFVLYFYFCMESREKNCFSLRVCI